MECPACPNCGDNTSVTRLSWVQLKNGVVSRRWNCRRCLLGFEDPHPDQARRLHQMLRILGTAAALALPILWLRH
jgi:hypothetical protein